MRVHGIRYKPKFVLYADLKACFDNINRNQTITRLLYLELSSVCA